MYESIYSYDFTDISGTLPWKQLYIAFIFHSARQWWWQRCQKYKGRGEREEWRGGIGEGWKELAYESLPCTRHNFQLILTPSEVYGGTALILQIKKHTERVNNLLKFVLKVPRLKSGGLAPQSVFLPNQLYTWVWRFP